MQFTQRVTTHSPLWLEWCGVRRGARGHLKRLLQFQFQLCKYFFIKRINKCVATTATASGVTVRVIAGGDADADVDADACN